jgi:hypothetical protein
MLKYNKSFIDKLVAIITESGYKVRFEKGNFVSGYALVMDKKIVLINKFLSVETKVNTLMDIMFDLQIDKEQLTVNSLNLYKQLIRYGLLNKNESKV